MSLDDEDFGSSDGDVYNVHEGGDDDAGSANRPLLPPDDRLWRHPSEIWPTLRGIPDIARFRPGHRWGAILGGGLAGALVATGVVLIANHVVSNGLATPVRTNAAASAAPQARSPGSDGTIITALSIRTAAQHVAPSMISLEVNSSSGGRRGSGIVYRSDGTIITTDRLVHNATAITAVTPSDQEEAATVIGEDPATDIAIVHIPSQNLPPAVLAPTNDLRPGEFTIAVTTGDRDSGRPAIYMGTVDELGTKMPVSNGPPLLDMIETDTPVTSNVDGGALLDSNGKVVGIIALSTRSGSTIQCLAIPVDDVRDVAEQLITTRRVAHAWLGIQGASVTPEEISRTGAPPGVKVVSVTPSSPAAAAGLKPGDVITDLDLEPVTSVIDLQADLHLLRPGALVNLVVLRHQIPAVVPVMLQDQAR